MNILAQALTLTNNSFNENSFSQSLRSYISPHSLANPAINYAQFCEGFDTFIHSLCRTILIETLEKMDLEFRNSPHRTAQYYVKQTRTRTIITLWGEITYKRTEYIDRRTNKPYCYVDRKLGLLKRMRFDVAVCSLIYEAYSRDVSMTSVGRNIGERIHGYSLSHNRQLHYISRQSVWNILNRFKEIHFPETPQETIPEVLYVMADEKYVPTQRDPNHKKRMVKTAAVFESRKKVGKNRYELVNKRYFSFLEGQFWPQFLDHLTNIYDLTKVKQIYIMGDGADWIKAGVNIINSQDVHVKYASDRFHVFQAIGHITKDKKLQSILLDYVIHNKRKDFNKIVDSILQQETSESRIKTITEKRNYIISSFQGIQVMYKNVKIGCSMEQVISHILARHLASIPKAYSYNRLPTYVNNRINQENGIDLRIAYLQAIDKGKDKHGKVYLDSQKLDFSLFDKHCENSYHLPFPDFYLEKKY